MRFERTRDYRLVRTIMQNPQLYGPSTDDFAPPADQFRPREDEAIWYVLVFDSGELLGLFALAPQNHVCWEIHTRLLPKAWGEQALAAGRAVIPWIWENTPCRRLVTSVPHYNRLAVRFAERGGLVRYGINPASYMKRGRLHAQVLLGISAPAREI